MFQRVNLKRSRLSKSEFLTILSSKDVWEASLSEKNIVKGFQKCGIYPLDREAYPKFRFSPMLLNRYNTWVQEGKKELTAEELDNIFNGKAEKENATKNLESHIEEQHREDVIYQGRQGKFVTYFIPDDDPHEMINVSSKSSSSVAESPVFAGASSSVLVDSSTPKSNQDVSRNPHKFKELCLQKLDKIQVGEKSTKNVWKRRKVNPYGSIVTSADAFEVAEKNLEKGKPKSKRLKQEDEQSSEDSGEELLSVLEEDSDDSYAENEDEESNFRPNSDLTQVFPPGTERQAYM